MPEIADFITDHALLTEFDVDAVERGRAYAADGAVLSTQRVEQGTGSMRVFGAVRGSRGRTYHVLLEVDVLDDGLWVEMSSHCSCPVRIQCKHGAAVAIIMSTAERRERSNPWERSLRAVVTDLAPPLARARAAPKAIAIRVDHRLARRHSWGQSGASVHLRLLNEGARSNWIKTGLSWASLPAARRTGLHRAEQVTGLQLLHAGLMADTAWHTSIDEPGLADFGPQLADGLAAAVAAGVTIVPGEGVDDVTLLAGPVDVVADVVSTPEGARLTLAVPHAGRLWTGASVLPVGRPAHSVVLLDGDAGAHHVVLAPFSRLVPESALRLLTAEPLELPETNRDTWADVLLPQLDRQVRVGSSDGTVEIRPLPTPRLQLTVEWSGATQAALTWQWRYGDGRVARRCLIDSPDSLDSLRDPAAEADLLARVPWPGPPVASEKLSGAEAWSLAVEWLPRLRESRLVDVEELDAPDFREAEGEIEIALAVDDTSVDPEPGVIDWLDLSVTIRVEGEQAPLALVLEALTLGLDHVVLPSGLYVGTDRPEFAALDELVRAAAEVHEREGDRIRVNRHDLGIWAQLDALGVVGEQAEEWVRRARALTGLTELPRPEPVGVTSTLRAYQLEGFHWLAFLWQHGLGGVLADDMGLGKTLQVLALVNHAQAEGAGRFLVVAPTSVVTAWATETARHTPDLRVATITASARRRGGARVADIAADADIVVTSYTLLRLEPEQYAEVAWSGLVLDEAQQVKNHQGKTYGAVRQLDVPFKLAVTGTPFENRLMELWSLLSITNPGLYPWPRRFAEQVASPVEKAGDAAALRRFRGKIRPFVLRRTKDLVARDLPPKQEQVLGVELNPRHRRIYDTHLQRERQKILGLMADFDANRIAIFSALTRLRQLALDPGLIDAEHDAVGSAKIDVLVEHLSEIVAEGHQVLVFSQFTSYLARVRERLTAEGLSTCYLDGSTRDRGAVIEQFRAGAAPVFLISLKAGGVGLTLTEADYVFVLDPWWNPATEAQAVDRAHRIGQEKPVFVYRMVSTGTIEEKVMELKARKAELFAQVVDGDGMLATAIGVDDVKALLTS